MTQRVVTFESAGHFRWAPELAPFHLANLPPYLPLASRVKPLRLSHLQSHRAFLLATPPLLETHIMKTCKLIVCAAPSACRRLSPRSTPEQRLGPFGIGLLELAWDLLRLPGLADASPGRALTGLQLTHYQSRLTNHLSRTVRISTQLQSRTRKSTIMH